MDVENDLYFSIKYLLPSFFVIRLVYGLLDTILVSLSNPLHLDYPSFSTGSKRAALYYLYNALYTFALIPFSIVSFAESTSLHSNADLALYSNHFRLFMTARGLALIVVSSYITDLFWKPKVQGSFFIHHALSIAMILITLFLGTTSFARIQILYFLAFMTALESPTFLYLFLYKIVTSNRWLNMCYRSVFYFYILRCFGQLVGHFTILFLYWDALDLGFQIYYCIFPFSLLYAQYKTICALCGIQKKIQHPACTKRKSIWVIENALSSIETATQQA